MPGLLHLGFRRSGPVGQFIIKTEGRETGRGGIQSLWHSAGFAFGSLL